MACGERALGIHDAGKQRGQLLELGGGGGAGMSLAPAVVQHAGNAARFQLQPEGFRAGSLQEGIHQLRGKMAVAVAGDLFADGRGMHQQFTTLVISCRHGIHPVHQINQVGLLCHLKGQAQPGQGVPWRVVVAHRFHHGGQWRKACQQAGAILAVLLRTGPVELADQMLMGAGGRYADIVQQAQVEQEIGLLAAALQDQRAIPRHDAYPFAMRHIINSHQVQCVGQSMDDFTQIDMNAVVAGGRESRSGHGRTFARLETWPPACWRTMFSI